MRSLKASEEKYRELIEGTDLLVTKLTIDGLIKFVNQKSEKFLGFSSADCIGKKFTDFVHAEDRETATIKLFEWVNQKPSVSTFENRMIHTSGKVFHFLWTITAIKDENGKCIGLNSIGRDISSYKEIQNQLQHASKMKAIGTLAGGIAHDFNNLLAGILGYAEVALLELPDTNPSRLHILEIRKISLRARELIRHILTFSRQTPFEPYPVQVHEIVEEVIPMLRATLPSTIEIQTKIANCGTILADQSRVHQIIMNLCTNSFHAMEEKGGILTLTLQPIDISGDNNLEIKEGKYIQLSIKDTGIGIPAKLQTHIFDPFFTTKKVNKGTGLGLSVVHGIVTELNSYIRFKSESGKGSTFTIYFPLSLEKPPAPVEVSDQIIHGENENIIIVDDEEIVAGSLNALLKKHGYRTSVFTSSKLAFEMIRSKKIRGDLLITDMTMPEMTGIDLIQGLSTIVPDLPVILCTGYNDQSKINAVSEIKVSAFLTKPIDIKVLLTTIRTALENKTNTNKSTLVPLTSSS
jgi:PAS domain S-box-containing protein